MDEWALREEVASICRRVYERGLTSASGGNASARLSEREFIIKPSGFSMGEVGAEDLVVVDMKGELLRGSHRPSSEARMHAAIYRVLPEAGGIIHAHPPAALAFAVAMIPLKPVTEQSEWYLGEVPIIPRIRFGTEELAEAVGEMAKRKSAELRAHGIGILLGGHGAVAIGKSLREAFFSMELIEETARATLGAAILGRAPE
ncbi:MAG: class II aldolase/adducin family protein [Candidatus Bathyarchaeia archaeon]